MENITCDLMNKMNPHLLTKENPEPNSGAATNKKEKQERRSAVSIARNRCMKYKHLVRQPGGTLAVISLHAAVRRARYEYRSWVWQSFMSPFMAHKSLTES